ncbi:uncharacterized protein LOC143023905 [Oratosquilla oratoria]|uniref:uncharacterized protein LOC143023905 n=1 Tax=Oratosquilla oratoria TaxID=337810 RepID=UPI003F776677
MASVLEKVNTALVKGGLQPINKKTLLYYYAPMDGCFGYGVMSTQMFAPELYENFNFLFIPKYISLTNCCLTSSVVGSSLFLYSRPHMALAAPSDRLAFSVFGSLMFNLGSMLFWALGRTAAPESTAVRLIFGVATSAGALYLGHRYVTYIDSTLAKKE